MAKKKSPTETVIIKKYANRRLYDTSSSSYVTLEHLAQLVKSGVEFVVQDAKTGEDLTRSVLTQIIYEQETKGEGALPLNFLRQLIGFYESAGARMLPAWLDMSMNSFADAQKQWLGAANPLTLFEKQAQRNIAAFQKAMTMFMPASAGQMGAKNGQAENADTTRTHEMVEAMQAQMAAMQAQLAELSKKT